MSPVWIVLALLPILGGAERFNCRGRILGAYYADAKSGCKAFHVCVRVAGGGIRDFRFFCPPGTLFHQEAQTCTDWGDDDPLACPADIYDGFDTKKLSPSGNREDEAEFALQRAETGDRRLSQNNQPSGGASDLRAAHSSDFFSGQRDRGRDDSAPQQQSAPAPAQRQSFRRATTPRSIPTTTQYTTVPPPPPQPPVPSQYDITKRKVIRKRPIYTSTALPPTTYAPSTTQDQTYTDQSQNFNRRNQFQNRQHFIPTTANVPPQYREEYVEVSRVTPKQNRFFPNSPSPTPFSHSTTPPPVTKKEGLVEIYNYEGQSTPGYNVQNENRPFKVRNSFNVVPDVPKEPDFVRTKSLNGNYNNVRGTPTTTVDYNSSRGFITSTPAYRNFNSVSYEPEKNNFAQFSGAKQSYYNNNNSPTTIPTTTAYATTPVNPSSNFNTVAYNTNLALNTQAANYAESNEDDGQYRPPQGEDDGQYRPELYEREKELLSGAHSLNIAASGNRLPEEQKLLGKQISKSNSKTAAVPRPFRPPTPFSPTTAPPEIYTTIRLQTEPSTQRTFDYYQTYTTTSRPYEAPSAPSTANYPQVSNAAVRITTTSPPRNIEQRVPSRETLPPTTASTPRPRPPSHPPHFAKPPSKKEDNSYDYAYYDSDPGFSEYDHIEEFGRTKSRV
ncbi:uncharacterized protein [Epargyreus clarus]|uniref:uncharacterized protein isoform X2 n=1 Tax=Epargyreus clarus TaxID=520877 RepID=UPI003C308A1F